MVQSQVEIISESTVDGSFENLDGEALIRLRNGQLWLQVSKPYFFQYKYAPNALIIRQEKKYYMKIEEPDEMFSVIPYLGEFIDSSIVGTFSGFGLGTKFNLSNGQIWEQISNHSYYRYIINPRVFIYKPGNEYKIKIEGASQRIGVKKIS